LVPPGSILRGKYAEIDILLQSESASECSIGFEELVRPRSILTSKYSEINILL
jgi:hypothetical protein